jgi:hypothetical protein
MSEAPLNPNLPEAALTEASVPPPDTLETLLPFTQSLLRARTSVDVLRAVGNRLARDASALLSIHVEREARRVTERLAVRFRVTPAGAQEENTTLEGASLPTFEDGAGILFVEDAEGAGVPPLIRALANQEEARSAIVIPIRADTSGTNITELVAIIYHNPKRLREGLRQLFTSASEPLTAALRNQHVIQDVKYQVGHLQRRLDLLQYLNQLAVAIGQFQDEKALMDYGAEVFAKALNPDHVGIVLLDPDEAWGTVISEYPPQVAGTRLDMRENDLFKAVKQDIEHPLVVHDVETDPRILPQTQEVFRMLGLKATMFIPLVVRGKLIGSIGLDQFTRDRFFTPEMIDTAQALAAQLVISLENIRLYEQSQMQAQRERKASEVASLLISATDVESVLNLAAQSFNEALGAIHTRVHIEPGAFAEPAGQTQSGDGA